MRIIHHILLSALLLICTISCEIEVVPQYEPNEEKMISFSTAEDVWPVITKAAISGIGDLYGDGFRVWGNWTDVADNTDNVNSIFGQGGVVVSATDKDNDSDFEPGVAGSTDSWEYEDKKGWNVGYHSFAAVLPSSAGYQGSLSSSFSKTSNEGKEELSYENTISLDLSRGLDLSKTQIDLMYAFNNIDNSNYDASVVELDFRHAFAKVDIQLSFGGKVPYIQQIRLYGIPSQLVGELNFYHSSTTTEGGTQENFSNNISKLSLQNITNQNNPFAKYSYASTDFVYASPVTPVDDLLVFPCSLSEYPLYIEIDVNVIGQNKTISTVVNTGSWSSGGSYIYTIDATNI